MEGLRAREEALVKAEPDEPENVVLHARRGGCGSVVARVGQAKREGMEPEGRSWNYRK